MPKTAWDLAEPLMRWRLLSAAWRLEDDYPLSPAERGGRWYVPVNELERFRR